MDRYPPLREAAEAVAQPYVDEFQWRVSTAQAKAQFSALVAEAAFGGAQIIIE